MRGEVVDSEWHTGFDLRFTDLTQEEEALLAELIRAEQGAPTNCSVKRPDKEDESPKRGQDLGRVLVAEDDPVGMRLVTAIIEKEGYAVVPARDGREAYRLLQRDSDFAAAIFDMMMPHLRGLDLIRHMRTEKRLMRIPVMLITAEPDIRLLSDSFSAGATAFLHKPFTPEQLQATLRMLLGTRSSTRRAA